MPDARLTVLNMLTRMEKNSYSNLLLAGTFSKSELSAQDKKFAAALFYGVIERRITLDYIVDIYGTSGKKIEPEIRQILRMGLYQLLYMDSVPDNAAVDESVQLTKKIRKSKASGFVNALLRNFIRRGKDIKLPDDEIKALSVEYSCPEWLVKLWKKDYGDEILPCLLGATVGQSDTSVRVNTTKITPQELLSRFENEDISASQSGVISECINIKGGTVDKLSSFTEGLFHVQDISSQLCCKALSPASGDKVLDVCAAPGGKSFTLAEIMGDNGVLLAFDLHEKRVELIRKGAERLGLKCIKASSGDAGVFNPELCGADKILCDVPCAGLGVIRKKPEIKYKNPDDFKGLPVIQMKILENASKYLKVGGELVYSTCSLNRAENDEVIDGFLKSHENFVGVPFFEEIGAPFGEYKATIFSGETFGDGFFISKIRRIA